MSPLIDPLATLCVIGLTSGHQLGALFSPRRPEALDPHQPEDGICDDAHQHGSKVGGWTSAYRLTNSTSLQVRAVGTFQRKPFSNRCRHRSA